MIVDKTKRTANRQSSRRWLKRISWGILVVICALLGGLAISNLLFSSRSDVLDHLTDLDKARVVEVFHMRRALGDSIWAGWADANIPVILYNEEYAFLVGISNPAWGWRTVPQNSPRGGSWESVPDDSIDGREYYRQRLVDESASPQAFTVRIGAVWAVSMTTKEGMTIKMGNEIRDRFPPMIRPFVPYRLIARVFLGLAMNTDAYICAIGHECFHAFQGMVAPNRLASAESTFAHLEKRYPWNDPSFNGAWDAELNALADALVAKDDSPAIELSRRFLSLRRARRLSAGLDSALMNLERIREWEEGLGKYTELALWKRAGTDSEYRPVSALQSDPDFSGYKGFGRQWAQEMSTLRLQSHADDIRFYYGGMAQAFLLDRLLPTWKLRVLQGGVHLEDLLNEAVTLRGS